METTVDVGKPTLKVRGKMFVCIASHSSAEPGTLVVMMDFPDRDVLIEEEPDVYYLKEHYVNYPCVLCAPVARVQGCPARSRRRCAPLHQREDTPESERIVTAWRVVMAHRRSIIV